MLLGVCPPCDCCCSFNLCVFCSSMRYFKDISLLLWGWVSHPPLPLPHVVLLHLKQPPCASSLKADSLATLSSCSCNPASLCIRGAGYHFGSYVFGARPAESKRAINEGVPLQPKLSFHHILPVNIQVFGGSGRLSSSTMVQPASAVKSRR